MLKPLKLIKSLLLLIIISGILGAVPSLALGLKDGFSSEKFNNFANSAGYTEEAQPVEYYIGLLLTGLFSILGVISIALIIYSGFTWMTARGNQAKVDKAKDTLIEVSLGLLFIIGGYALTTFLLKIFS